MYRKPNLFFLTLLLLSAALVLSGCSTLIQPVTKSGIQPTPVEIVVAGGVENPDVYVDPAEFKDVLLKAITAGDREKLQLWMTEPFLSGAWRADLTRTSAVDALESLYAREISANHPLSLVKDVDLQALLGGKDPRSIPRAAAGGAVSATAEAAVVEAVLVSGWGSDGLDEALLFIARQPDNSLKWHGWMRINGGFSGARFGGVKAYQNDALGFSVYVPADYGVFASSDNSVSISGPIVEGAGHPGNASIEVEPANGRTAEAAAQQTWAEGKELMGEWGDVSIATMNIDDTTAHVVFGVPGQSIHRQLFMVHNDLLYHMWFFPDEPQSEPISYRQMENMYAMITNTFVFTK